ncbi:unannotated protein [freshwater metagenome]|uniref:Unannotated protein n=1 Tax=freshwater metagenome TaxID=449393 RepID=A0A6J6WM65_9ZZZZ
MERNLALFPYGADEVVKKRLRGDVENFLFWPVALHVVTYGVEQVGLA